MHIENIKIVLEAFKNGATIFLRGYEHVLMDNVLHLKVYPKDYEDCDCEDQIPDEDTEFTWVESDMTINDFIEECSLLGDQVIENLIIANTMVKTGRWKKHDNI